MPSAELLAAAAKLTEAQADLRYFFSSEFIFQLCVLYYYFDSVLIAFVLFKFWSFLLVVNGGLLLLLCWSWMLKFYSVEHVCFREAELEEDTELFIGPPPPAMVAEAESANEAERFEEV